MSNQDDFSALWGSIPDPSQGGDEFSRLWADAPGPQPKKGLRDRLREALSPRTWGNVLRANLEGLTSGGFTTTSAAVESLPSLLPGGETWKESFDRNYTEERTRLGQMREESPIGYAVAEGVGAAIPAMLTGGGSALLSAARSTPRAAPSVARVLGENAAFAGAMGANQGDTVGEKIIGGLVGAGIGTVAGGALTAATLPSAGRPVVSALGRAAVGGAGGAVLNEDDRIGGAMAGAAGFAAAPHVIRVLRSMNQVGAVGDDVSRAATAGNAPASARPQFSESALVRTLKALRGDRPDLDLDAAARAAGSETAPRTVQEFGNNVRGLSRAAKTVGGRAKTEIPEVLEARGKSQGDRIKSLFQNFTGIARRSDPNLALQEQAAARNAGGNRLYGETFSQFPDAIDDPQIAKLLDDIDADTPGGSVRGQVDKYVEALVRRGKADPSRFYATTPEGGKIPTLEYLDLVKQAAQRRVKYARRDPQLAREFDEKLEDEVKGSIAQLRDALVERTGGEEGAYSSALRQWGGDTEVMGRIDDAAGFLSAPEREVAAIKAESSEAAWDMYRQVALDQILDHADQISNRFDLTKRKGFDLDVPAVQRKLRLLFDDDEGWNAFRREMAKEVEMAKTESFNAGGSNTADKLMEVASLFDLPIEAMATGNPGSIIRSAVEPLVRRARTGYTSAAADDLVDVMTAGGKGDTDRFAALMEALRDLADKEKQRNSLVQPIGRGVSAGTGGWAGQ